MRRSKIELQSYAEVTDSNGEFLIILNGWNSKQKDVSVQLTICDWQFSNMIEQVGKLMLQRIERAKRDYEDFKRSIENIS